MAAQPKLKLIETSSPDIDEFEPLLITTQEQLDQYWPQMAYWLEPCVAKMNGEVVLQDLYDSVKAGRTASIIAKCDKDGVSEVAFVLILEGKSYPRLHCISVIAIGGRQMDVLKSKFWKHVCSWAFMSGASKLEAQAVSPAVERILRRYGFNTVYTTMRLDLAEM